MLKKLFERNLFARRFIRNWRLRNYQDCWVSILEKNEGVWGAALNAPKKGRILIATSVGAHLPGTIMESLLAAALTLRGAEVHLLLCDEVLPACLDCMLGLTIDEKSLALSGPQKVLCRSCYHSAYKMYSSLGLRVHRYSEFLSDEDIEVAERITNYVAVSEIKDYTLDGLAVGEHALAGALRFYARGTVEENPRSERVLKRYFKASLLTVFMMRNLLGQFQFDCAVFHHGIYVPQGLIGEVCRVKKIRVVNWNPAYRKSCFIFSHGDTYHHTLMNEPTEKWENLLWNQHIENNLLDYLKSRWYGTNDWIWFYEKPQFDIEIIAKELGIDFSKPCVGMLTNVIWDAQLHYPANIFPSMLDWLIETIAYFQKRPDVQLVIRVHPAEIRGTLPSRQPAIEEVKKRFPKLGENIFIIPPDSHISTYAIMSKCNSAIIYGTKTGVELTSMGIPVIVAGEAWIRNKGITIDPKTREDYFATLDNLPLREPMGSELKNRAHKYAYHFFFRRMIPVKCLRESHEFLRPFYKLHLERLEEILPGKDEGMDIICNGIMNGSDFIYPAEIQYST